MKKEESFEICCSMEDWNYVENKFLNQKTLPIISWQRDIFSAFLRNESLTQTEKWIWLFLAGHAPRDTKEVRFSTEQIGEGINRSPNTASKSLKTLAKKGHIKIKEASQYSHNSIKHNIAVLLPNVIENPKSFIRLPKEVFKYLLKDPILSQTDKFVWLYLTSLVFTNPETRELQLSSTQIGRKINRKRSTVSEALKALAQTGYIKLFNPVRLNQSNDRHKITVLFPKEAIKKIIEFVDRKQLRLPGNNEKKLEMPKNHSSCSNSPFKEKSNFNNPSNIFFGINFRFSDGVNSFSDAKIPFSDGVNSFSDTYNNPSIRYSFNNIINIVLKSGTNSQNTSKKTTFEPSNNIVENVYYDLSEKDTDKDSSILEEAQAINDQFHMQRKELLELGIPFMSAVKQADEKISDEERKILTKAANIAYAHYKQLHGQYISEGHTEQDSDLKAQAKLSILEQELFDEYVQVDPNYQTRLNRCLLELMKNKAKTNIKFSAKPIPQKISEDKNRNNEDIIPPFANFSEKLEYLECLYQQYESIYQKNIKDGMSEIATRKEVYKYLTKSKKQLFFEVASIIYKRHSEEIKYIHQSFSKSANLAKEINKVWNKRTIFEQKLIHEYIGNTKYTILDLPDLCKPVDKKAFCIEQNKGNSKVEPSICFSESKNKISSDLLERIVGWLCVMKKKGEIPKDTSAEQMSRWVEEITHHAIYWRPTNVKFNNYAENEKMKVAISVACRAIRNGTWKTPYGITMREIIQRELEAQHWKALERKQLAVA